MASVETIYSWKTLSGYIAGKGKLGQLRKVTRERCRLNYPFLCFSTNSHLTSILNLYGTQHLADTYTLNIDG